MDAVVFDLDGTLLDTIADLAGAMNTVLERLGRPTHPVEAYKFLVGDGMDMLVRRAVDDEGLVERGIAGMREEYGKRWDRLSRPYEGVDELLDGLAERGIPRAILSNKPHEFTVLCVRRLLPGHRFVDVRGVSDATPRKPDPKGALDIARTLGVDPARVAYLGDTNTDMRTARAAGMRPFGCAWGFRPVAELVEAGAETILDRPTDLLGYF